MKQIWIIAMLIIMPLIALASTPKVDLGGTWKFKTDPYGQGESLGWHAKDIDTNGWDGMPVPGNWDLYNEYSEYVGDAWYTRTFEASPDWANKLVRIVFQSVYNDSKVWINGVEIGENHFGFLPFEFDISKHLVYDQPNRITVMADNRFKRGAIWNWGGIRRPVWLEVTENVRIEYQHITAVPNLKNKSAHVNTQVALTNKTAKEARAIVKMRLVKDGSTIGTKQVSVKIPANATEFKVGLDLKLSPSKVKLWSFDHPELYQSEIELSWADKNHVISDNFGIRKIEVQGIKLLLNGEEFRPVGFNLVAEDRVTGNTLPFEHIKRDVDMLKELGVTFCRVNHLPLPKEYLDYLDEKGILTFEEVSLWGKDAWVDPDHPMPKEWLRRMIKKKYNHPSIAGWSVGNEIGFVDANPKVMEYVEGAIAMTKQLDPTRLAVYVTHSAPNQKDDPVKYSDLIMLNKYKNWGEHVDNAWKYHKKPIFMSEFAETLNHEDPDKSQISIEKMMDEMRNKPYVLGASLWTFKDYRSFYQHRVEGKSTPPSQNRAYGIVNTFRQKKRSYYALRDEFAPVKGLNLELNPNNQLEEVTINKELGPEMSNQLTVTIVPRSKLDIPARVLDGYKLQITSLDENFEQSGLEEIPLKKIAPGDGPLDFTVKIPVTGNAGVRVDLVDPQGHSILDQTKYKQAPDAPIITQTHTAVDGISLHFDKVPGATEYMAIYARNGEEHSTKPTINNFIRINDPIIKHGEEWTYKVVALNNFGASVPSKEFKLAKDEDELPPVVWKAVKHGKDLVIGFTVTKFDYVFDIEYGVESGNYAHSVTVSTKGVTRIPNAGEGKIYFRIRTRKQWGFASEWSQEKSAE